MTTIKNNFHNTEFVTTKPATEIRRIINTNPADYTPAEKSWVHKVRKALCGTPNCTCGGELSERGPQEY